MLTLSKPLSAGQVRTYHEREFASERQNYWSRDQQGHSEWQGKLAEQWGLRGEVGSEHFARLTEGQHPFTEQQLVRHQVSRTYEGKNGKEVTSVEHRAGWDATFSAPKSVSLTALVGGDERVRVAHRDSVRVALEELERYTQARIGNVHAPETTGKFVAATFEHDTARPVEGYAAPQLHTHAVIFNVTERDNGQTRSVQSHELYASQHYATSIYRAELASRLQGLGYEIESGRYGQPEIKGYTKEYLEASSPRREQIKDHLREQGLDGAGAAQVAAHHTRDSKELLSPNEVLRQHRELAAQYGYQADRVVAQARAHDRHQSHEPEKAAQRAVTYARDHLFEKSAVQDRRALYETALQRGMGEVTYSQVRKEVERRFESGEFRQAPASVRGPQITTAEMIRTEKEIVGLLHQSNGQNRPMLLEGRERFDTIDRHPELNTSQRQAVEDIFAAREKIVGMDGVAGAGKTTTLAVIREGAEREGYAVEGFAPTSRAAQKLGEAGIETSTLQMHLARGHKPDTGERRLYVLDESSLASTKQMHEFLTRLHLNDRVLLVGDRRQHEAVQAGRPFVQLQQAGMKTVSLDQIVRQKDPELRNVVEQLARGEVGAAVKKLDEQGRVHEFRGREKRIDAIAKEYAKAPESTLVVSPDNRSRTEINSRIHAELQQRGSVNPEEYRVQTLAPRQDLTGAARTWAEKYEVGDVLRYSRGSKETGIRKGEYARVIGIDAARNQITVALFDGRNQSYDPRRQQGVSVYREEERAFSVGDRIQFTAPDNDLKIANREMGTVERINEGRMSLRMDGGRSMEIDPVRNPHLDHGYAVTSHSSQGQTAERVLVHVDTELGAKDLLNNRMAYVAVSRGAHDAQIFTNDREKLPAALGHEVSQQSAHEPKVNLENSLAAQPEAKQQIEYGHGISM
ncbi:MobF family relaxase [Terriglobus albidus]|uniref:MobF family relaxase n=1 Tax=Terriglobus albidus TaxID=1592106 RepID=UPI0021E01564|nr:MobF family relaxase [Terriglobus albidus]